MTPDTRMDAPDAAQGGDMSAMMIEIIQNPDATRRMAHARHARSRHAARPVHISTGRVRRMIACAVVMGVVATFPRHLEAQETKVQDLLPHTGLVLDALLGRRGLSWWNDSFLEVRLGYLTAPLVRGATLQVQVGKSSRR